MALLSFKHVTDHSVLLGHDLLINCFWSGLISSFLLVFLRSGPLATSSLVVLMASNKNNLLLILVSFIGDSPWPNHFRIMQIMHHFDW